MKKGTRLIKRVVTLLLVLLLSIESFAAIVSDNDGSAFITKAEFDSLKNEFQAQIDNYNTSIDNKIDGAIAAYLAGIRVSSKTAQPLLMWPSATLGLVEQPASHPYVEGTVGGVMALHTWVTTNSSWLNGNSSQTSSSSLGSTGYMAYCYHALTNSDPEKFKYLVANYGKVNSAVVWDLLGYSEVKENINIYYRFSTQTDYTNPGVYHLGYCEGWTSTYGTAGTKINKLTGTLVSLCETCTTTVNRGTSGGPAHNKFEIPYENSNFSSEISVLDTYKYLTNLPTSQKYKDVFPSEWYGTNKSDGADEHKKYYDLYGAGWTLPEGSGANNENYHFKYSGNSGSLYGCDNKTYMRKGKTTNPTSAEQQKGWIRVYTSTASDHRYYPPTKYELMNLFKSTTGDSCTSDNLYSSEIGKTLYSLDSSLSFIKNGKFDGQSKRIAPLYVGLPLGEVKKGEKVYINLDFLDDTDYEVAFKIDSFDQLKVENTNYNNAGVNIKDKKGLSGNKKYRKTVSGKKELNIQIEIEKTGVLYFKYGVTGEGVGRIKLPKELVIEKDI